MRHRHTSRLKHTRRANPRALQQDRGADGAGGEYDLASGITLKYIAIFFIFHPERAISLQQYPLHQRAGNDPQVLAISNWSKIGVTGGCPQTLIHSHVHLTEPLLLKPVAIVGAWVTRFKARVNESLVQWIQFHIIASTYAEGTATATILICAPVPCFGALVVRQACCVIPASSAGCLPLIDILGVTADVDHAVNGR